MNISSISAFAVRNWQFTLVVFAMLVAVGFNAFSSIPRAEDPDMKGPFAVVNVALPGADPADIEKLVIRPIEDAVNRLDDLDEIKSRAEDGLAIIQVQFDWSTDPDKKYDDVVREINALRPTLPAGIRRLDINKFRTSLTNVVQVALVSETAPNRVLEDLADDLTDEIYRVPGVRDAEAWGLPRSEVRVSINFGRLANLGIPVTAVANAVGADAAELPGGPIHAGARRFNLKTAGGYDSIDGIRNTVIGNFGGNIVRVRDVAEVSWATEEATYLGWYNGERAVFVTANQKEGQNVFDVRNGIYRVLDEFEPHLPPDVRMERVFDQTVSVSHRLSRLYLDFAIAVSLVAITLLPLGFRAAGIVMVSIPLSLAIGVALLDFFGFSLNQLSIAGLVLALGLLVDDSIVVVENIERHLREGKKRYEAAIAATSQISLAVVGCTAVLILAFLPLLFLPGGAGKFTRSLPVSVLFTVSASLLVALTIIP
ncbi:MAG: efflux RND transporter permease subunit, partial [Parvibaculum sp.]|nr:efflux RND transporter permease subunit [Parvibaculum sp.]